MCDNYEQKLLQEIIASISSREKFGNNRDTDVTKKLLIISTFYIHTCIVQ